MVAGATFAQGDANYDHAVTFADLLIVAQGYGGGLLAAAASVAMPAPDDSTPNSPAARAGSKTRRSGTPIAGDVLAS